MLLPDVLTDHQWPYECLAEYGIILVGVYAHFCWDWDGLMIDEKTPEFEACSCFQEE